MPKIMKLTDVGSTEQDVQKYIDDDNWVMQQKFDGTRIQMQWDGAGGILWSNDGVGAVTHSAAKLKLPALEEILRPIFERDRLACTLEGELLIRTGEFILWDVFVEPETRQWRDRHDSLDRFFLNTGLGYEHPLIKLTPTAFTAQEKRALWERINVAGVEGAVSKHQGSFYEPGVRTKEWVKHKLCKTADLVVLEANRTFKPNGTTVHKGSAKLGYYDGRAFVPLTASSLIGKDLSIAAGDVVEIEYLYLEPGGSPVQPRIKHKRWDNATQTGDKKPWDCTMDQFPKYSREVVQHG